MSNRNRSHGFRLGALLGLTFLIVVLASVAAPLRALSPAAIPGPSGLRVADSGGGATHPLALSVSNQAHLASAAVDAFAHFVPNPVLTATIGTKFTIDLFINSGNNTIVGQQSYMTFTNSLLQVVNTDQPGCVVTSSVKSDTTTFEVPLQNVVDNAVGEIAFASGTFGGGAPPASDFRVAQISFCASALGDAVIHWQFSPPAPLNRNSKITDNVSNTVSNPALYFDGVIHVTPVAATATSTAVPPTSTAVPPTSTAVPPTSTAVPPTATSTTTPTPTISASATPACTLSPNYQVTTTSGATLVPGTSFVPGSTCNSCVVQVNLPFSYQFYGTPYSQVQVSNKGNLQFVSSNDDGNNTCLPSPGFNDAIFAYWDNHNTNINDTLGMYTSLQGIAPNRIFTIEWRPGFEANDVRSRFEVRLYEGQPKFDVIYGQSRAGFSATIGVQKGTGERFTQYACDTNNSVPNGTMLTFDQRVCSNFGSPRK